MTIETIAAPVGGAELRLHNVHVRYPGRSGFAVADASLIIQPGEFVVVLGHSGSGKSTLLRTVNRLVSIDSGRIEVDGRNIAELDATQLRRSIGYVIQAIGLFPHLTVAQNIAVVPELLGWEKTRIASRVDELLELVRLDPAQYRTRRPRMLSGGEAQRVGVARALAAEPRLLLMDEPFGALDAIVRDDLQREMLEIVSRLKTTTLFITHDIDEALRLADRLVVMGGGKILQVGTPTEVIIHPATPEVARLCSGNDLMRSLSVITVGSILDRSHSHATANHPTVNIDVKASLRDAVTALLRAGGNSQILVQENGEAVGVVDMAAISTAVGSLR